MQAPRPRGRRCFPIYGGARAQILHCGRRVGRHRSRRLDRCAATRGAIRDQANAVAASRRAGRQLRSDHRRCRGPGQHEHRAPHASRCGDRLRRRRHAHAARRRRGAACIEPRRIVQGGGGRRTRRTKRRSAREGGCRVYRRKGQAARVACAPSGTLAADPEKVWHGVLSDEPPGFDPAGATSASAASVLELVFDRLLTYDYLARPAKVVPLAAEALPIAEDDAKTWTVRIRKGIYFAPDPAFKGVRRELVAQDFVFSFMRFMDPAINSPYQFLFRIKLIGLDELRAKAQKTGRFDYDARIAGIEDLVNVVMHGNAQRAQMLIPPGVVGYDSTYRNANGYDPALANPLLDRFGYKRGPDGYRRLPDGRPFTLTRNTSPGATYRDMDKIWHAS